MDPGAFGSLSTNEIAIAKLVSQGRTNPEIASLGTSEQAIKNHLRQIFDKLGVWSRLELQLHTTTSLRPAKSAEESPALLKTGATLISL